MKFNKKALEKAFNASPEELGQAAIRAVRERTMAIKKEVTYTCDRCGTEPTRGNIPEFWMTIDLKSKQYLYDDGTQPQNYKAIICRDCKVDLLEALEEFGARLEKV